MPDASQLDKITETSLPLLTGEQVAIRDAKVDDLTQKIMDKNSLIERMKENHANELAKLQAEIDEHTLIKNALAALK